MTDNTPAPPCAPAVSDHIVEHNQMVSPESERLVDRYRWALGNAAQDIHADGNAWARAQDDVERTELALHQRLAQLEAGARDYQRFLDTIRAAIRSSTPITTSGQTVIIAFEITSDLYAALAAQDTTHTEANNVHG